MRLNPHLLLRAYTTGAFPMADARESERIGFYEPHERGVFDLSAVHVPRRFARWLRSSAAPTFKIDQNFAAIIRGCAEAQRVHESGTWINEEIERVFNQLHELGHAHCVGAYSPDGGLIGGLYGLHLGGIFFGESMFSKSPNASKACFIALCASLQAQGFSHIDAQMDNPHLRQFGLQVWPAAKFKGLLTRLLTRQRSFPQTYNPASLDQFLQSTTQTS